jgi:cytoskeletal protein CcmA (bactofilin family)
MKRSKGGVQTFLGPQTTLEGKLIFEGVLRLDGHFSGSIESKTGTVIVGRDAVIDADVSVETATVSGELRGNIHATDRIELNPPARVFGDLTSPVILIDAGVVFRGNCTMEPNLDSAGKTIKLQPKS